MKKRNPDIIKSILNKNILYSTKPSLLQTFWDCLRPSDRANLVQEETELPEIYSKVNLDSQTEI